MALSLLSNDSPETVVRLQELADKAGITLDEARYVFIWLLENVFAKGNWIQDGKEANVIITVKGSDEAERLRMPFWKRFLTTPTVWYTVAASIISGLTVGIVLKWLF